jgi:predicted RNase H-like HicB family nuclease
MNAIPMDLVIELDREEDGRWIAEIATLAGVLAYGVSRDEAIRTVKALALRVLADRLEHGEDVLSGRTTGQADSPDGVSFSVAA